MGGQADTCYIITKAFLPKFIALITIIMLAAVKLVTPAASMVRLAAVRPAVFACQNALLTRSLQTSATRKDIDQAAKYIGSGAGIGSVFGSLIIVYARNPGLKQQVFSYAILGFALSEAMGLFCLMMAFLILFAF